MRAASKSARVGAAALICAVALMPTLGSLSRARAAGPSDVTWTAQGQSGSSQTTDTVNGVTTSTETWTETSHQTSSDGQTFDDSQTRQVNGDGTAQEHDGYTVTAADGSTGTSSTDSTWDSAGNETRRTTTTVTDKDGNQTTTVTEDDYDAQGNRTYHGESSTQNNPNPLTSAEPTAAETPGESPAETPSETPSESPTATSTAASTQMEGSCGGGPLECYGTLTPQPSTGMFVAVYSLQKATSYKFSMTLVGAAADPNSPDADFAYGLSQITPGASCGSGSFTVKGTITNQQPASAHGYVSVFDVDVSCPGLHIIRVGDSVYIDQGNTGTFTEAPGEAYDLDFLSPENMVRDFFNPWTASYYTQVGSETKDGVSSDRYRSDEALDEEEEGGQYDTWSADVWVAQDGGNLVSMDIVGKEANSGGPYEVEFDITNVNDPANIVTAPAQ